MDVARLRRSFPALEEGLARFDGPGGSLVPDEVAAAVASALTDGLCQRGSRTAPERRTEQMVAGARTAMARFLGADPAGIVFGRSMTALTLDLARTLARDWRPGDEVVVTRLDHDANVHPWVAAARRVGAAVRRVDFDPVTGELDDVAGALNDRTRLVALTGASNLLGTRPDVTAAARAAHEVGALVHVDAVHLAAHVPVDLPALGADVVTCSPYKFCGPHLGVLAADPALLGTLRPEKLDAAVDTVPERFELGTLPVELLAGVRAAVEFLESHGGMAAVAEHESRLWQRLLAGLEGLRHVRVHGRPARRTPTLLLDVDGHEAAAVSRHLAGRDVIAPAGSFYAPEAARHAGLGDAGAVRVGLAPYTDATDVDRLVASLAELAATPGAVSGDAPE